MIGNKRERDRDRRDFNKTPISQSQDGGWGSSYANNDTWNTKENVESGWGKEEGELNRNKSRNNYNNFDSKNSSTKKCFNCNEEGHRKQDCPKLLKDGNKNYGEIKVKDENVGWGNSNNTSGNTNNVVNLSNNDEGG